VVGDQVHIQVMKAGTPIRPRQAEVLADDSDLALLTVDEPGFFDGTTPVTFGSLPRQRDHVAAYGFPAGATSSASPKAWSRASRCGLYPRRQQPADRADRRRHQPRQLGRAGLQRCKCIGVSFQRLQRGSSLQNTGYFIPMPVVNRFLKDIADGHYDGVPGMGVVWQKLENPSLREWLGLKQPAAASWSENCARLGRRRPAERKRRHPIPGWGGVAENGTIPLPTRSGGPDAPGDHAPDGRKGHLKLWRGGKLLDLDVPLGKLPDLVPGPTMVLGPATWSTGAGLPALSANYLRVWKARAPPASAC